MKIINSHYIPLPEPHWLIADPCGEIYEHLGTLTVIEQNPDKKKGEYGIITHHHPVVAFPEIGYTEDAGENINIVAPLSIPNGQVLDDIDLKDCSQICLSKTRTLSYIRFNILAYKLMVSSLLKVSIWTSSSTPLNAVVLTSYSQKKTSRRYT